MTLVMGRPPNPRNRNRTSTGIRFEADIHERLRAAAEERHVAVNFLVNRAVEEFLDRLIPVDEMQWTRPPEPDPKPPVYRSELEPDVYFGVSNLPHSRACGITPHPHGPQCSRDCPTCWKASEHYQGEPVARSGTVDVSDRNEGTPTT